MTYHWQWQWTCLWCLQQYRCTFPDQQVWHPWWSAEWSWNSHSGHKHAAVRLQCQQKCKSWEDVWKLATLTLGKQSMKWGWDAGVKLHSITTRVFLLLKTTLNSQGSTTVQKHNGTSFWLTQNLHDSQHSAHVNLQASYCCLPQVSVIIHLPCLIAWKVSPYQGLNPRPLGFFFLFLFLVLFLFCFIFVLCFFMILIKSN